MGEYWMRRLDLPDEPAPNQSLVEICGCSRVLVEQHCGVIQYSDREVCVKVRFGRILICGSDLMLARMTAQQVIVSGCIDGVRLERRGKS